MNLDSVKAFLASPMAGKLLAVAARTLGTVLATYGVTMSDSALVEVLSGLLGVAVYFWSNHDKVRSQQKFNTAAASAQPITEKQAEQIVAAGDAPSVLTPKTNVPILVP